MRPKNFSGETIFADCGRYETSEERKCGSVVAAAMASTEPGSGVSGAVLIAVGVLVDAVAACSKARITARKWGISAPTRKYPERNIW
jgi:hypothetical protein